MKKFIIILLSIIFASCDRLAKNVDVPKIDPELVLFSFLSPDENIITATVSFSSPVFGKTQNNNSPITNAIVTITNDGGQTASLLYVDSLYAYVISQSNYKIEAGRTYNISASAKGKSAYGSCTVPTDIVILTNIHTQVIKEDGYSNTLKVSYKWQDKTGAASYYRVTSSTYSEYFDFYENDTIKSTRDDCTNLYNDENQDGKILDGSCEVYIDNYTGDGDTSSKQIDLYLLNTDVHYYEYHKRIINYYGDDPFSQPYPQYNNVKNGLGVVCAYRKYKTTTTVK